MSFKNISAERTTVTRDTILVEEKTGNIYESLVAISTQKLQEFATHTDNLEEVFENREQIEISKHYEKMPKPTAIAMQELLEEKIYLRKPESLQ
jgi:type IV secretory pathway TrbF-like protein